MCVVVGVTLGVMCSQSDRFENFMKPVLDTMQVMPAFVYLFPALFFFGIENIILLVFLEKVSLSYKICKIVLLLIFCKTFNGNLVEPSRA